MEPAGVLKLVDQGYMRQKDIAPIRRLPVIARYILKVPISALDLGPENAEALLHEHRQLNGGRMVTTTSGFWRGADGEPLAGARSARSAAYRAWARSLQPKGA